MDTGLAGPLLPVHRPCLAAGCMPGLHPTFLFRPARKAVKKPLVRWGLIGPDLDRTPESRETRQEVVKEAGVPSSQEAKVVSWAVVAEMGGELSFERCLGFKNVIGWGRKTL